MFSASDRIEGKAGAAVLITSRPPTFGKERLFAFRKNKDKGCRPQGGSDLARRLAELDGFAAGLAEEMFASAAGEIEPTPDRFRLASARMFEKISDGLCAELRASGADAEEVEALETVVTMGTSHARLKFETKWKELSAAMPNVQEGAKN